MASSLSIIFNVTYNELITIKLDCVEIVVTGLHEAFPSP